MIIFMLPDISLALYSWQSLTQTQPIHVIPDRASFIEKGFRSSCLLLGQRSKAICSLE